MHESIEELISKFLAHSAETANAINITEVMSVGIVVDNDDPLQQGRLRIFCPSYNDNPKKLLHLPWAGYVTPVGGAIDNRKYTRGHVQGEETTVGPVHYGFWAIPEIGAHAIVACINGDPRRRIWLGCLPSHQETHTLGNGRFKHIGGEVLGPHSSSGDFIQPTAVKLQEAFDYQMGSAEWRTRAADYQITTIHNPPANTKQEYRDSDNAAMKSAEPDDWVDEVLGDHGYDWTGFKNLASFLASRVFSWSTPGFHSIQMDDRAFNSRIRIRTTGGSQIILDDTNERMYFSVSGGKSWIEMDASGNIDMYAERRMSIHSEKDLNFSSDESIRFKAGTYISMYAGDTRGQDGLPDQPNTGEIRFHASNDMHLYVERELQARVQGNTVASLGFTDDVGGNPMASGTTDINFGGEVNIGTEGPLSISTFGDMNISSGDITFAIAGHSTTVNEITTFLDTFVETYNDHSHINAGLNLNLEVPLPVFGGVPITIEVDEAEFAPWTNRVPEHEPWPRVLKQDKENPQNAANAGSVDNVDWIDQYTNVSTAGRIDIGKVEGTETIDRGPFWRR